MGDDPILPVMSKIATARRRQLLPHHGLQFQKGVASLFRVSQSKLSHREYGGALGLCIRERIFQNLASPCRGLLEFSLTIVRERFRAAVKCIWYFAFAASDGDFGKGRHCVRIRAGGRKDQTVLGNNVGGRSIRRSR